MAPTVLFRGGRVVSWEGVLLSNTEEGSHSGALFSLEDLTLAAVCGILHHEAGKGPARERRIS